MHEDILLVLRVEFDRAVRLRRPLSALVLMRPDLAMPLAADLIHQASVVIANCTRAYDAAGLITDRIILLILPESEAEGVRIVADRIRKGLAAETDGKRRWSVLEFPRVEQFGSPDRLLEAARRMGLGARTVA